MPQTATRPDLVRLTPADRERYHRDGYVIVPGWFEDDAIARAREAAEQIVYGRPFSDHLADPQAKPPGDGLSQASPHGRCEFPTGAPDIDRLFDERLLDAITDLLGVEPMYQNAHIFPRAGNTDARHAEHPWQGYHVDHDTYSFLPASADLTHAGVIATLFMTDVDPGCAPLHVVPRSHRQASAITAGMQGGAWVEDIRAVPGLAAPVPALGRAGSVLFYSTYLLHAAVPFRDKRAQRILMSFTSAPTAHACWTRYATPYRYGSREHFLPFWSRSSPRMRSYFGWPPPGHPYYTAQTLAALAARHPEMDLTAYYAAMTR